MRFDEHLLVLAAGRGIGLDGFHKLNLVDPQTKETILERYLRQFGGRATIVLGYRAPEVITRYPNLNYIYNDNWSETGSAYSGFLGLQAGPKLILPADLIIEDDVAKAIKNSVGNKIFLVDSENRSKGAINAHIKNNSVESIYSGSKRHGNDPEFKGIIRLESELLQARLGEECGQNSALSFAECLNSIKEDLEFELIPDGVTEINTIGQYMELFLAERP